MPAGSHVHFLILLRSDFGRALGFGREGILFRTGQLRAQQQHAQKTDPLDPHIPHFLFFKRFDCRPRFFRRFPNGCGLFRNRAARETLCADFPFHPASTIRNFNTSPYKLSIAGGPPPLQNAAFAAIPFLVFFLLCRMPDAVSGSAADHGSFWGFPPSIR